MTDQDSKPTALAPSDRPHTGAAPAHDALVAAAADRFDLPVSTISSIDARRQWAKARIGLDVQNRPIDESFDAAAAERGDIVVVTDAQADATVADARNAGGAGIRFYAGAPLRLRSGETIGTICVVDVEPRGPLDPAERAALEDLARRTVTAFELRRDARASALDTGVSPGSAQWLDQASSHLAKAWAALDLAGATAARATLEQVIVDVEALRLSRP